MTAYYNEVDPFAAAWLRELITAGLIAPGDVDDRDIRDVTPNDIAAYDQCHFFAGIGTWSYALRQAGWPDDQPVWTGSCPCQPFSSAGTRDGFDDERHLWPSWFWLIKQSGPGVILGEQVASHDGLAWLDLVQADLENEGYFVGVLDLCAAGFGAPHLRQRLYFVADISSSYTLADAKGESVNRIIGECQGQRGTPKQKRGEPGRGSAIGSMADAEEQRGREQPRSSCGKDCKIGCEVNNGWASPQTDQLAGNGQNSSRTLANAKHDGGRPDEPGRQTEGRVAHGWPGPVNGYWRDADWLLCRDGKYRAVEPGTFPLAHGATARVGRLRGYGNAIVAPLATEFIRAYIEIQQG